jgi:hypothetical protein
MSKNYTVFADRKKGQRFDKPLLRPIAKYMFGRDGGLVANASGETVGTFKVTGFFTGSDGRQFQALECHIPGWIVPAFRRDVQYPVCQDFSKKAVKV